MDGIDGVINCNARPCSGNGDGAGVSASLAKDPSRRKIARTSAIADVSWCCRSHSGGVVLRQGRFVIHWFAAISMTIALAACVRKPDHLSYDAAGVAQDVLALIPHNTEWARTVQYDAVLYRVELRADGARDGAPTDALYSFYSPGSQVFLTATSDPRTPWEGAEPQDWPAGRRAPMPLPPVAIDFAAAWTQARNAGITKVSSAVLEVNQKNALPIVACRSPAPPAIRVNRASTSTRSPAIASISTPSPSRRSRPPASRRRSPGTAARCVRTRKARVAARRSRSRYRRPIRWSVTTRCVASTPRCRKSSPVRHAGRVDFRLTRSTMLTKAQRRVSRRSHQGGSP